MNARCDLHVHSRFSTDTGNYALKRARLGESYTDPERVYRVCKQRGMRFVTISDHNTVEGALRIAHLPDTFLSVEVTTQLPEAEVPLHVLVWNLSEQDHRDLQPLRPSVDELVAFLRERGLAHALAHPLYRMGPSLTPTHVGRLLELFTVWEGRNGARPQEANELATRLAVSRAIGLSGGSDDHGALDIASTWTEADGDTVDEFLADVMAGSGRPAGAHGSTLKLAHALAALGVNAYREGGGSVPPLGATQLRALFDEDADDPQERHEEIRAVSRHLTHLLGGRAREGVSLHRLDTLGTRLSAVVSAVAVQAPYLATAHHHAGSREGLDEIEEAYFGRRKEERELTALVFTDTFDETNGVAGTMRRLAAEGERGALPVRVATAAAQPDASSQVITFTPDWTLALPTYEQLELRFPLVTDVLERVEAERPDVIHVATPGPVGVCGLVAARLLGIPLVGSYHTELGPYALHLTRDVLVAQAMDIWVDWFYKQCATLLAPTSAVAARPPDTRPPPGRRVGPRRGHRAVHAGTPPRPDARAAARRRRVAAALSRPALGREARPRAARRVRGAARTAAACSARDRRRRPCACITRGARARGRALRWRATRRGARRGVCERGRLLLPEHDGHVRPGAARSGGVGPACGRFGCRRCRRARCARRRPGCSSRRTTPSRSPTPSVSSSTTRGCASSSAGTP